MEGKKGCGERSGVGTTRVGLSLVMVMVGERVSGGKDDGKEGGEKGGREVRVRLSLVVW